MFVIDVIKWIQQNADFFDKENIIIDYIKKSDKEDITQFAVIDFVANKNMGRITIWEEGYLDLEIIEIETEFQLYYLHIEVKEERDLNWEITFKTFFDKLIN